MIKDKITGKEALSIMILFILGSSLVTGGSMKAEQDSWISVIVALAMSIPVVLVYARLNKIAPKQDYYDMAYMAFGKFVGAVVTLLFSLYTIHLGALVIKNFTAYIQVVSLPETPQLVSAACVGLIAYFAIRKGIEVLGRSAPFVMPIAMFVIIVILLLTTKYMNINNLKPILTHDTKLIFSEAYSVLAFPFAETVMFISVFSCVESKKYSTLYLTAILISGAVLTLLVMGNIMVLGFPMVKILYFPSYETAGVIDVGNALSRIEVLVSSNFVIFGLMKVIICLYVSCRGLAKLFKIKSFKILAAAVSFSMVVISQIVYENTMQMFAFLDVYKYYAPFFQILIPVIILLVLQKKATKNNIAQSEA